jgi:hypothetical protein
MLDGTRAGNLRGVAQAIHMNRSWKMTRNNLQRAAACAAMLVGVLILGSAVSVAESNRRGNDARPNVAADHVGASAPRPWVDIALSQPEVPRVGTNRFEVKLRDGAGEPVRDAEVSVTLYRRALFGPKGPIQDVLRANVRLTPGERAGSYEGVGNIPGAGAWDVTVHVKRQGADVKRAVGRVWAQTGPGGQVRF